MFDIISIGSATVDAFIHTGKGFIKKGHYTFPIGSKFLVGDIDFKVGGGGTNTAVAFSRLGLKTAYLGKMGMGANSLRILDLLKKEKVDHSLVCRNNARTGFSVVLDAVGTDRTILVYKGSNSDLREKDIDFKKLKAKWFYLSSMIGKSLITQKKIINFAAKNNIKIAFNPGCYMIRKNKKDVKLMLRKTELLILNREEATLLLNHKDTNKLLWGLKKLGPKIVVITDGKNGVHSFDGKTICSLKPHNIKIRETTGAGDSFSAGFLVGLIRMKDTCFALQVGLANAESVIRHVGAKNKLLTWKEAMRIMKKNPGKIISRKV